MIANTQYNDFKGTVSADICINMVLNNLLKSHNINTKQFSPIGFNIARSYEKVDRFSIICIDLEKSSDQKNHIVNFFLEDSFNNEDFFKLFERFNLIMFTTDFKDSNIEFDEEVSIN